MRHERLARAFFNRPTLTVAKELLGKFLVRKIDGEIVKSKIIETEAYCGTEDKASHASRGLTPRTKVMFGLAGFSYVYLIYGMYHCLNIVTERDGYPAAVLIRGIEGYNGPGRVCRFLKIDRSLNNIDITKSKDIWIENGPAPDKIKKGKRIGVDYAGKWKERLWRFRI